MLPLLVVVVEAGCGLQRPADPAPFDCAAIDRAAERFPEECGEAEADAGIEAADMEDAP